LPVVRVVAVLLLVLVLVLLLVLQGGPEAEGGRGGRRPGALLWVGW